MNKIKELIDRCKFTVAVLIYRPLLDNFNKTFDRWESELARANELDKLLTEQNANVRSLLDQRDILSKANNHLQTEVILRCAEIKKLKK